MLIKILELFRYAIIINLKGRMCLGNFIKVNIDIKVKFTKANDVKSV